MRFLLSLIVCCLFALPANATIAFSGSAPHRGVSGHHRGPTHTTHQGHHGHHSVHSGQGFRYQNRCYDPYRQRPRRVYVYPSRPTPSYPSSAGRTSYNSSWISTEYVEPLTIINPFFESK